MAQLRWAREAQQWVHDIFDYIARDNPAAAERVVWGTHTKAQLLTDHLEIGYHYRVEEEGEMRVLLYGHYRIAYLYRENADVIDVLGVFHGALDIDRYMQGEPISRL